jgi:ubiquinone/menaquinone biosynthesis C-methylase UbiE
MDKKNKTSWGNVAGWYNDLLEKEEGTYQKDVILPNILRLLDIKKGEVVLDLACGQGFFSREFFKAGAEVVGADISSELIDIAKRNSPEGIKFVTAPADDLSFLSAGSVSKITIILAIQNIENLNGVLKECERVLKSKGKLFLVMNHPAFRIPKQSSWDWDDENKVQYRRIDEYLTESRVEIQMHPGDKPSECTVSFHRPLQVYFKALRKNGFYAEGLEEWISHKKSEPGPRAVAENKIRKEIPIFLFIQAVKSN